MPQKADSEIKTHPDIIEIGESDTWRVELQSDNTDSDLRMPVSKKFLYHTVALNYHSINRLQITHKLTGKTLDILEITPKNWSHKLVQNADETDLETTNTLQH